MLALGADMNALTEDSNTPLHLAIMGGSQAAWPAYNTPSVPAMTRLEYLL